jgi:predicted TIM-barrel fold metal-dependent hydrolase
MGSDYPYEMHDPTPVDSVRAAESLSPRQIEKILAGNLARVIATIKR